MSKRNLILILMLSAMLPLGLTAKTAVLTDLIFPQSLTIDGDKIYVTEQVSIYIYSAKDLTLVKKFGKQGEGPGEFMKVPSFNVTLYAQPEHLVINSPSRVSIFSKDGTFIKESKVTRFPHFQPLGKSYAGFNFSMEKQALYLDFQLYDPELKKIKSFFKIKSPSQRLEDEFNPLIQILAYNYRSHQGKIFICDHDNESIHVFDAGGKKLFQLEYDFNRVTVTAEHKNQVYEFYRKNSWAKDMLETMKRLMKFPDQFPPIRDFCTANGKLYVTPYAKENGENYFYVFDTAGKFLKKFPSPLKDRNIFQLYPYTFEGNLLYQLVENEEMEWELHIHKLSSE